MRFFRTTLIAIAIAMSASPVVLAQSSDDFYCDGQSVAEMEAKSQRKTLIDEMNAEQGVLEDFARKIQVRLRETGTDQLVVRYLANHDPVLADRGSQEIGNALDVYDLTMMHSFNGNLREPTNSGVCRDTCHIYKIDMTSRVLIGGEARVKINKYVQDNYLRRTDLKSAFIRLTLVRGHIAVKIDDPELDEDKVQLDEQNKKIVEREKATSKSCAKRSVAVDSVHPDSANTSRTLKPDLTFIIRSILSATALSGF